MSRSWLWDQKDDQKVVAWTAKASEEALLAGDSILASEILKGASNFFALRAFGDTAGGNSELVSKWLWGIHSDIYAGTANIYDLSVEPIHTLRSVPYCFKLLNSFLI